MTSNPWCGKPLFLISRLSYTQLGEPLLSHAILFLLDGLWHVYLYEFGPVFLGVIGMGIVIGLVLFA